MLNLVACFISKNIVYSANLNDFNLSNSKAYSFEVSVENQEGINFSVSQKLLIQYLSNQLAARSLSESATLPELIINLDLLHYKVERGYKTDTTLDYVFDD